MASGMLKIDIFDKILKFANFEDVILTIANNIYSWFAYNMMVIERK